MSQAQLSAEINNLLDALQEEGREWHATWITHEICNRHSEGLADNDHRDFWRHCGYSDCRREVTRCINRRAGDNPKEADLAQLKLPGYEHLQRYYVVKRDDEDVGVPIYDLTDDEVAGKAAMYRAMGTACFAHAKELERFREQRRDWSHGGDEGLA